MVGTLIGIVLAIAAIAFGSLALGCAGVAGERPREAKRYRIPAFGSLILALLSAIALGMMVGG